MTELRYVDPLSHDLIEKEVGVHVLYPTGRQVLLKTFDIGEITKGGIIITDTTKENEIYHSTCGLVLAYGPYAWDGDKFDKGPFAKVGQWAVFPRYAPKTKVTKHGLIGINDTDILFLTPNPSELYGFMN